MNVFELLAINKNDRKVESKTKPINKPKPSEDSMEKKSKSKSK
jgi:hypothetical protein